MLLLFWLVYKRPIRQVGLHTAGWYKHLLFGGAFGTAAILLATIILLVTGTARFDSADWNGLLNALFWIGLMRYIFVGFFEELLSRGVMMTALKTTRNKWIIIFLPAVIFGLLHALNDNVTFFSLCNIALVGVLFAYLFIRTGRLWAPIGFHITWNFVQGNVLGIPVSGGSDFSVIQTLFTGPDWLTGGAFGVEGGAACTLVLALGLAFVHFCIKQRDYCWRIDSDLPLTRGPIN